MPASSLHKQFSHCFLQFFYVRSQIMDHGGKGSDISAGTPVPSWMKHKPLLSAFTPGRRQSVSGEGMGQLSPCLTSKAQRPQPLGSLIARTQTESKLETTLFITLSSHSGPFCLWKAGWSKTSLGGINLPPLPSHSALGGM